MADRRADGLSRERLGSTGQYRRIPGGTNSGGWRTAASGSKLAGRRPKTRRRDRGSRRNSSRYGPDLILSHTLLTTAALLQQACTIPIIFANVSDSVGSGFVASFPRPGGNVTGFNVSEPTLAGKLLERLKEIAPRVARVAMLSNPATATYAEYWLNPSKPPLPHSQWWRLKHVFATGPNSNPSLPHRHASRMVALS